MKAASARGWPLPRLRPEDQAATRAGARPRCRAWRASTQRCPFSSPPPERPHRKRTGSQAKRLPRSSTPQKVTGLNRCSRSLLTAEFAREGLSHCAGRMSTKSKGKHQSAGPSPGSKENSHGKIQRRIPQFEESTSPTKQKTRSLKLERYRPTTKLLQVLGATSDTFSPQPAVNRSTRVTLYGASLASDPTPVSVTEIFTLCDIPSQPISFLVAHLSKWSRSIWDTREQASRWMSTLTRLRRTARKRSRLGRRDMRNLGGKPAMSFHFDVLVAHELGRNLGAT